MATHGPMRCLDPTEPGTVGHRAQLGRQGRGGEEDWLVAVLPANNLIHLPDKLAGVFDSLGFRLVAVNLVHLPDPSGARLAGVGCFISLNGYLRQLLIRGS